MVFTENETFGEMQPAQLLDALRHNVPLDIQERLWPDVESGLSLFYNLHSDDGLCVLYALHEAFVAVYPKEDTALFFVSLFSLYSFAGRGVDVQRSKKYPSLDGLRGVCKSSNPLVAVWEQITWKRCFSQLFWDLQEAMITAILDFECVLWSSAKAYLQNLEDTKSKQHIQLQHDKVVCDPSDSASSFSGKSLQEEEIMSILQSRQGSDWSSESNQYSEALKASPLHDALFLRKMPWEKVPPQVTTFSSMRSDDEKRDEEEAVAQLGVTLSDQCSSIVQRIHSLLFIVSQRLSGIVGSTPITPAELVSHITKLFDKGFLLSLCDSTAPSSFADKLLIMASNLGRKRKSLDANQRSNIRNSLLINLQRFTSDAVISRRIRWSHDGRFSMCFRLQCDAPRIRPPFKNIDPYSPQSLFVPIIHQNTCEAAAKQSSEELISCLYPSSGAHCLFHHREFVQDLWSLKDVQSMLKGALCSFYPYIDSLYSQNVCAFFFSVWHLVDKYEHAAEELREYALSVDGRIQKRKHELNRRGMVKKHVSEQPVLPESESKGLLKQINGESNIASQTRVKPLFLRLLQSDNIPQDDPQLSIFESERLQLKAFYKRVRDMALETLSSIVDQIIVWLVPEFRPTSSLKKNDFCASSTFPLDLSLKLNQARANLQSCSITLFSSLKQIALSELQKHFSSQFLRSSLYKGLLNSFGDLSHDSYEALSSSRDQRLEALRKAEEQIKSRRKESSPQGEGEEISAEDDDFLNGSHWFAERERERWKQWIKDILTQQNEKIADEQEHDNLGKSKQEFEISKEEPHNILQETKLEKKKRKLRDKMLRLPPTYVIEHGGLEIEVREQNLNELSSSDSEIDDHDKNETEVDVIGSNDVGENDAGSSSINDNVNELSNLDTKEVVQSLDESEEITQLEKMESDEDKDRNAFESIIAQLESSLV